MRRWGRKGEEGFGAFAFGLGEAIAFVLFYCVFDALGEVGFEFDGGDGDAVEEEDEIDRILVVEGVAHLADDAEAVGGVGFEDVGVEGDRGFELGEAEGVAESDEFDAVAQYIEGAALVDGLAEAIAEEGFGVAAVGLGEGCPGLGLGGLYPGDQVGGEEGAGAIVGLCVVGVVEPAVSCQIITDFVLEVDFFMQIAHRVARWFVSRISDRAGDVWVQTSYLNSVRLS
jgi:hypothetical protein